MASWRDNLQPASFRGVAFGFLDTGGSGGRRLAKHEFPFRNAAYVQNMGRKLRGYKIQAYVLGDNYFQARDALIDALEADGSGTLVHPYRGSIQVEVGDFTWKETAKDGRMASFEIEFYPAGGKPSPTSSVDTAGQSTTQASNSNTQLQTSFGANYETEGFSLDVFNAASALVASAQTALMTLLATPGIGGGTLVAQVQALLGLVSDAEALSSAVAALFGDYSSAVIASWATLDTTLTSRGPVPVGDPTYGLSGMAQWGSGFAVVNPTTPDLQQESDNQAALIALFQGGAVVALAQIYAQTAFSSQEDAEAARDQMSDLIDCLAVVAADAGDDAGYAQWQALYQAVTTDLTTRGKQLPDVVTYDFGSAMPALWLAERIYQDASQAGYLIARNAAPHPLFMPMNVEALSASSGPPSS